MSGRSLTGMAHVVVSVRNWKQTTDWYRLLLSHLEMTKVADSDNGLGSYETEPFLYFVGGKTAIGFHEVEDEFQDEPYVQGKVGLHHMCLRARTPEVVKGVEDLWHSELSSIGGKLLQPCQEGPWAPGYVSILLEDPSNMRFEINHVPGKGLLGKETPEIES